MKDKNWYERNIKKICILVFLISLLVLGIITIYVMKYKTYSLCEYDSDTLMQINCVEQKDVDLFTKLEAFLGGYGDLVSGFKFAFFAAVISFALMIVNIVDDFIIKYKLQGLLKVFFTIGFLLPLIYSIYRLSTGSVFCILDSCSGLFGSFIIFTIGGFFLFSYVIGIIILIIFDFTFRKI